MNDHIPATIHTEMTAAEKKIALDESCKRLLSEKSILAWILHACVAEFKDVPVRDIAEKYIEGTPELGEVRVLPEETNDTAYTPKIQGLPTEDVSVTEHTIYYDIRFYAVAPKDGQLIKLIINIEAQNKYHNSYALITRAIYYLCRMISAQYGTEFTHSHYEDIKKVYSIWVCSRPPKERMDTISYYCIDKHDLIGSTREDRQHYDLLCAVMICLGSDPQNREENDVLRLLDVLFNKDMRTVDKKQILENDFAIPMTERFSWEVERMCNMSQGYFDDGVQVGMEKGIEKGIAKGVEIGLEIARKEGREEMEEAIRNLMQNANLSFEQAVALLGIPVQKYDTYKKMLDIKQ